MYRPRSQNHTFTSDTPESDIDPYASLMTPPSSAGSSHRNTRRQSATETPTTSPAWSSACQSLITPTYQARRFYHRSSSYSHNPLRDPEYDHTLTRQQAALGESRRTAQNTIIECHQILTTLELSRMTATRMGTSFWLGYWNQVYPPDQARRLNALVLQAVRRIDILFRDIANRLHVMLAQRQNDIRYAASEAQITWELQIMEEHALFYRDRRRRKAQRIMDKLQSNLQNGMRMHVASNRMIDMKRGIFGLDAICDYYPRPQEIRHAAIIQGPAATGLGSQATFDSAVHRRRSSSEVQNGGWRGTAPGYCPTRGYMVNPTRVALEPMSEVVNWWNAFSARENDENDWRRREV